MIRLNQAEYPPLAGVKTSYIEGVRRTLQPRHALPEVWRKTTMALKSDPPTLLEVMPYAKRQRAMLDTRYGLTPEGYYALYSKQKGCCRICGELMQIGRKKNASWKKGCCVDHIEGTKRVRGLLCHRCNTVIGLMNHNQKLLQSAIKYLHHTIPFPL